MKGPLSLSLALALLAAAAFADDPQPRSFSDVVCDPNGGSGALVRLQGGDRGRLQFEDNALADYGLDTVEDAAPSDEGAATQDSAKPKAKKPKAKRKPKPKTFRLKAGPECPERLSRLGGALGDRLALVPDSPGLTPAQMEQRFARPGVWSRLKSVKFESPAALSRVFDNMLNGDRTALSLLSCSGRACSSPSASGSEGALVRVDGSIVKPDLSGTNVAQFKPRVAAPMGTPPAQPRLAPTRREMERGDRGTYPGPWVGNVPLNPFNIPRTSPDAPNYVPNVQGVPAGSREAGVQTPINGNARNAPIWGPFYKKFKECRADCEPGEFGIWRPSDRTSCHYTGAAIDLHSMRCADKSTNQQRVHRAIDSGASAGPFADLVACVRGGNDRLFAIWHQCYKNCDGGPTTNHKDHTHLSIGCGWGRK